MLLSVAKIGRDGNFRWILHAMFDSCTQMQNSDWVFTILPRAARKKSPSAPDRLTVNFLYCRLSKKGVYLLLAEEPLSLTIESPSESSGRNKEFEALRSNTRLRQYQK